MTESKFTYKAMQDVLESIAIAVDDRPLSLGLTAAGWPYNQNGRPALRVTDEHGWTFIVTARPESD